MEHSAHSFLIIDEEHRDIEHKVVRLVESMVLGVGSEKIQLFFEDLRRVTLLHFEQEDFILELVGFSEIAEHRGEHLKLEQKLDRVAADLTKKDVSAALRSLREFRKDLFRHLQMDDELYRDSVNHYAAEHGFSPLPQRIHHAM